MKIIIEFVKLFKHLNKTDSEFRKLPLTQKVAFTVMGLDAMSTGWDPYSPVDPVKEQEAEQTWADLENM